MMLGESGPGSAGALAPSKLKAAEKISCLFECFRDLFFTSDEGITVVRTMKVFSCLRN